MAVACGYNFSAAVGENGSLFAFGKNKEGQLGTNDNSPRLKPSSVQMPREPVRQVAAGYNRTGIVTDSGKLFLCGRGFKGILFKKRAFNRMPLKKNVQSIKKRTSIHKFRHSRASRETATEPWATRRRQ
tara:strand:+ start:11602 stop:11988 length:387 start_codon:yes stop_codon:yes gene_type:complete